MAKLTVKIPASLDSRFKSWRKILTGVDPSKSNGYCFIGEFTHGSLMELDPGTFILAYDEEGSAKYHYPTVRLLQVAADGSLTELFRCDEIRQTPWALVVRDEIAAAMAAAAGVDPHAAELAAAVTLLEAAGYTVTAPSA